MRGDIIYTVYGVKEGREKDSDFDSFRTRPEAEAYIEKTKKNWPSKQWTEYHDAFEIREHVIETDYEIPSKPTPRELFVAESSRSTKDSGWNYSDVVIRNTVTNEVVFRYKRNYSFLKTFEPFRQCDRNFALISPDYTATTVVDLDEGKIIASEEPASHGFCPFAFYVPDWHDVHDESILVGSPFWSKDLEQPKGDFGFVFGCVWGDDWSEKVQYLDLSRIQEGIITRDDRFGYVSVAIDLSASPTTYAHLSDNRVRFNVEVDFDLKTGAPEDYSIDGLTDPQHRSFVRPGDVKGFDWIYDVLTTIRRKKS